MPSKAITKITEKAEALHQLRQKIHQIEDESKKVLDILKSERDQVQDELLENLRKENLTSIKVSTGESYTRSIRKSLQVENILAALPWAKERNAIRIDLIAASSLAKDMKEAPPGFQFFESEYISVRKPKKVGEGDTKDQ